MKMTRRQFGIAMLGGAFALLFGKIMNIFKREGPSIPTEHVRARYWRRGDDLAG